jgi:hypothetical protein
MLKNQFSSEIPRWLLLPDFKHKTYDMVQNMCEKPTEVLSVML